MTQAPTLHSEGRIVREVSDWAFTRFRHRLLQGRGETLFIESGPGGRPDLVLDELARRAESIPRVKILRGTYASGAYQPVEASHPNYVAIATAIFNMAAPIPYAGLVAQIIQAGLAPLSILTVQESGAE
jgi:hypothetical protein